MKKIEFICDKGLEGVIPHPIPSKHALPDWFKKLNPDTSAVDKSTIKRCLPFMDTLTSGYLIPLWQDFYFDSYVDENDVPNLDFKWNVTFPYLKDCPPISAHDIEQTENTPFYENPHKVALKFNSPWIIKTPPGYSCLITSPLNRDNEFDFKIISGIVDTDNYFSMLNFPFIWKTINKKTLLPQGMPVVQIIPFRRENWKLKVTDLDESKKYQKKWFQSDYKVQSIFKKAYKKFFWKLKRWD